MTAPTITMYTTAVCPYCIQAQRYLKAKGVTDIDYVRVDLDPALRQAMMQRTGRRTVPPCTVVAIGSRESSLTMVDSSRQRSGTVRAIGPATDRLFHPRTRRSFATSPGAEPADELGLRVDRVECEARRRCQLQAVGGAITARARFEPRELDLADDRANEGFDLTRGRRRRVRPVRQPLLPFHN